MTENAEEGLGPLPPGMRWDSDNPLGVPVPVPDNTPTASQGPVEPVEVGDTGGTPEPETDLGIGSTDALRENEGDAAAALSSAVASLQNAKNAYDDAVDAEDCQFCVAMLEALREADFETQIQGLTELRELESLDGDGVTEEKLNEKMDDFEVIPQFAQAAMQAQQDAE